MSPAVIPTWVTELDLASGVARMVAPQRSGAGYQRCRVLVRERGEVIGLVDLPLSAGKVTIDQVRARLPERGADEPRPDIGLDGLHLPPVSVVMCTRDRPQAVEIALRSLLRCDHPDLEIVIVESAPRTATVERVIDSLEDDRVRFVSEPRPGLSRARNRGVAASRGEILAFTDDDVIADPLWLRALSRGFLRAPHVGCVTGSVPAAELETPAQHYFDAKVKWSGSVTPRVYDLEEHRADLPLYPYTAGRFGAGANFAVSRRALEVVGPFDPALGVGTPAKGGEDLDYFLRVIQRGFALAYEPSAVVWHGHRREMSELRPQMIGYGSGLSAYAVKHLTSRAGARDLLRQLPTALTQLARLPADGGPASRHLDLRVAELWGLASGPWRYRRARRLAGAYGVSGPSLPGAQSALPRPALGQPRTLATSHSERTP